ncbi:MAG TPA: L-seryl-tRNA(Sec) selenium transferase [Chthoniobacterales bacterium]|nr:L-seryl-tRNA(Sec) selenium transferase [Chthoniobacterales bacterium]
MTAHPLRAIASVDKIVQALGECDLPRRTLVALVRREVSGLRAEKDLPGFVTIVNRARAAIEDLRLTKVQRVINGTGIIIHTNLGRAPLSQNAIETLTAVASGYSNLEYDLTSGERGSRATYLEQNLALLCSAEAATVVNNCAAALVLVLRYFTKAKREVIISRGELIQIGGGFRIPDILEASGATLREVGTTNRTSVDDYAQAIRPETAMILKVHRSNFSMRGFVESTGTESLARLARTKRIPLVEDLGRGAIVATEKVAGIAHEPRPAEILKGGADLVVFSGDKLFGGPQAGIVVGKKRLIAALKREPFFRALRCDKLILAALQTTVDLYLAGREDAVPVVAMMRLTLGELQARARNIVDALHGLPVTPSIGSSKSQLGGGTLPESAIPSVTLDFESRRAAEFAARLRRGVPPVIGYIAGGKYKLDLRTISPAEDEQLIGAIRAAARQP